MVDFRFKNGWPADICSDGSCTIPKSINPADVREMRGRLAIDCARLVVTPENASGELFTANGKRYKSKEPPFFIQDGSLLASYFCERPSEKATAPPVLKKRPTP